LSCRGGPRLFRQARKRTSRRRRSAR
jgi:hypothetical protein